jgi:hypothetical protein
MFAKDFFEIDLSKVKVDWIDPDWQRTPHNYTREEIREWMENLREIQRLCREKGYRAEDFERMRQSPDPKERAIGQTYHKLYDYEKEGERMNHDYILVEWVDDHYEVLKGRHRVWMAQQIGLRHMPAMVYARDEETLRRLRAEGERIAAGEYPIRDNIPEQERHREERRYWLR